MPAWLQIRDLIKQCCSLKKAIMGNSECWLWSAEREENIPRCIEMLAIRLTPKLWLFPALQGDFPAWKAQFKSSPLWVYCKTNWLFPGLEILFHKIRKCYYLVNLINTSWHLLRQSRECSPSFLNTSLFNHHNYHLVNTIIGTYHRWAKTRKKN